MVASRCWFLTLAAALAVTAAGCGDDPVVPVDADLNTVCNDGVDNDGDQSTDYPADPGCSSELDTDEANAPIAKCNDGRDNDGDTRIDYPDDPGCFSILQDSETDDCPDGPNCPACSNATDDDADGQSDYPADMGCITAGDHSEYQVNPNACGAGLVVDLLDPLSTMGSFPGSPSHLTSVGCGGAGGEKPYAIVIEQPSVLVATTDLPQTNTDTVLYLRTTCGDEGSELGCNDNLGAGNSRSRLVVTVDPGVYYLIVDGRNAAGGGNFGLRVELFAGEGQPCTVQGECGEGLQCWDPTGGDTTVCSIPQCGDDIDTDGDTFNGYPNDPGCETPTDFDELDECPDGPTCPACSNTLDDDGDGNSDYPDDIDCESAAHPVEGCSIEQDSIIVLDTPNVSGSTSGLSDDFFGSCDFGGAGGDRVHLVDVPAMDNLHFDTIGTGFNPALVFTDQTCNNELACDFNFGSFASLDLTGVDAGNYAIVVDGGGGGNYTLNISGTIASGGDCTGDLFTSGAISCGVGYACTGGVCLGNLECNNGVDDDGDTLAGYPEEPGCASPLDDDETDDCPAGPNCPECSNDINDDGSGGIDWPVDPDCNAASDDMEAALTCGPESDEVVEILSPVFAGTTVGGTDDYTPACGFEAGAPDIVGLITVPDLDFITFDEQLFDYDWLATLTEPSCSPSAEIDCVDCCSIQATNLAAGTYAVVVDGWSSNSGPFEFSVHGQIKPLGMCTSPLVAAGALECPPDYTCTMGRCLGMQECNNGVDDDGDGEAGYPTDPGCATAEDDDESDNCPAGPGCAACSDTVDNDLDGEIDYPDDTSCVAAGGGSEATCGFDSVVPQQVVIPLFAGTTEGGGDDFLPVCSGGSPAEDVAFALTLPVPVQELRVSQDGTSFDSVLSVYDGSCAVSLGCQDSGDVVINNAPAGSYGIVMDGWSGEGNYVLEIRGTVAPGTACTSPLFSTGVLQCPANHICSAGTCQPL
jgi:hypothetical protein